MSDIHIPQDRSYFRLTLTRPDEPLPMYQKVADDSDDPSEKAVIAAIKKHQADGYEVKVEAISITVRVVECYEQLRAIAEGRA